MSELMWTFPGGRLLLEPEETANDSDKLITVPTSKIWKILWIYVEYSATATAGNRVITLDIQDTANDVILKIVCPDALTANETVYFVFSPTGVSGKQQGSGSIADTKTFYMGIPPDFILPAGYDIRVYDSAAVDAAADDMVIQLVALELDLL